MASGDPPSRPWLQRISTWPFTSRSVPGTPRDLITAVHPTTGWPAGWALRSNAARSQAWFQSQGVATRILRLSPEPVPRTKYGVAESLSSRHSIVRCWVGVRSWIAHLCADSRATSETSSA